MIPRDYFLLLAFLARYPWILGGEAYKSDWTPEDPRVGWWYLPMHRVGRVMFGKN